MPARRESAFQSQIPFPDGDIPPSPPAPITGQTDLVGTVCQREILRLSADVAAHAGSDPGDDRNAVLEQHVVPRDVVSSVVSDRAVDVRSTAFN